MKTKLQAIIGFIDAKLDLSNGATGKILGYTVNYSKSNRVIDGPFATYKYEFVELGLSIYCNARNEKIHIHGDIDDVKLLIKTFKKK